MVSPAPVLNTDDFPEARLANARILFNPRRPRQGRMTRGERKLSSSVVTLVREADESGLTSAEVSHGQWACLHCTFRNSCLLHACEMCGESWGVAPFAVHVKNPSGKLPPCSDQASWPSLDEAISTWEICTGTSCDSWVDTSEVVERTDVINNSDFLFVDEAGLGIADSRTETPSWASVASTPANHAVAPEMVLSLISSSSCHRPRRLQKEKKYVDEDDQAEDLCLTQLNGRRLYPSRSGIVHWRQKQRSRHRTGMCNRV